MSTRLEHLELPIVPEDYLRRTRKGRGYQTMKRNKREFYVAEIKELNDIQQRHAEDKAKYGRYFDPKLIFKISINQSVSDESFREDLKQAGIETISASPDKSGYWVVFVKDGDLESFKAGLQKNLQREKPNFIDAISGIEEIPPNEKLGNRLKSEPFSEKEISYLDIEIWRMEDQDIDTFIAG